MTKDEALEMCLEYIETNAHERRHVRWAIKEALAQPEPVTSGWSLRYVYFDENGIPLAHREPEQEPVARVIDNGTPEGATEWIPFTNRVEPLKTGDLLYTTPPQRPWVGLSDEDITKIDQGLYPTWKDEVQAVEARLKELNNG